MTKTPEPTIRERLLKDPELAAWWNNNRRGSPLTADIYLRRLNAFCIAMDATPAGLPTMEPKKARMMISDFVSKEEARKRTGSFIKHTLKAVRSWLEFNGVELKGRIKVEGAQSTPTLENEKTPSHEELQRILDAANPKVRVMISMMAFSGVRPQVLGMASGEDGLRLGDIPDLVVDEKGARFTVKPAMVRVRAKNSKTRKFYLTFLGEQGCSYVETYLQQRVLDGEKLIPESPLIPRESALRSGKPFISTVNIGDFIRHAIRATGLKSRPYVLRCYFDTQLLMAESRGKIAHDYRVFFMGHSGSMDARYTTNKGRLSEDLVKDMRMAYKQCEPFLETLPSKVEIDEQGARINGLEDELRQVRDQLKLVAGGIREDTLESFNISESGRIEVKIKRPIEAVPVQKPRVLEPLKVTQL